MNKTINVAKTTVFSVFVVLLIIALTITTSYVDVNAKQSEYIDNSSLITPYVPDSQVTLDEHNWPTWVEDIIVVECVSTKLGKNGTLLKEDVEPRLKHIAETGANLLWLTPVQDMGTDPLQVTYLNYGPHTINPYLTGQIPYGEDWYEVDYDESRRILSEFVDLCHKYNIRVVFDVTDWGVANSAPIYQQHPEWFPAYSTWGGPEADNKSVDAYNYYFDSLFEFVMETKCDGLRWDLEPTEFGYDLAEPLHQELNEAGRKILFFSECENFRGNGGYAFEQVNGVKGQGASSQIATDCFFNDIDIVKAIRTGEEIGHDLLEDNGESGQFRYFAYQISCHDFIEYHNATYAEWAYQFLYGSFIPLYYIGEELNLTTNNTCYGADIGDFEGLLKNKETREYFETVKKLISYKWKYKHLVNKSTENHRQTNICTVYLKGTTHVQGYARYAGNEAFIVVPNVNEDTTKAVQMTVSLPFKDMELDNYTTYTVKDVYTDKVIVKGNAKNVNNFKATIEHSTCGLYHITAEGKKDNGDKETTGNTNNIGNDNSGSNEAESETEIIKKPVKKYKDKIITVGMPTWVIIAIVVGAVVLIAGGITTFIVLKKRKK